MKKVAVVGAGAAGLCAARHVLARPGTFAPPVVFELSDSVGGTWRYEEQVGKDKHGWPVHSSMYRDLRTNLPKEVMMFPDFPFEEHLNSFLPHQEIQRYLDQYSRHHNICPHIRFNTRVEKVKPVVTETNGSEKTTWEVTSADPAGRQRTESFDSVFVCSGHYSDPLIPNIPGIENFKGKILHSHSYKFAEPYAGQSVVVLGAKASGLDISIELAKAGAQVVMSHRYTPFTFPLPAGIRQSTALVAVEEDGSVRFQDGSLAKADILMFCTGYIFNFPFLNGPELGLQIQEDMVSPLYRFMLPPAFPSLVFIGVTKIICPFPNFNCQVQFALSVLDGSVPLPTRAQMEEEVRRELQEKLDQGLQQRDLLKMEQEQWDYCKALALTAGFTPLPPVIRSLFDEVRRHRMVHPQSYRQLNYRLLSDTQWELVN